jgi:hypothetical protein
VRQITSLNEMFDAVALYARCGSGLAIRSGRLIGTITPDESANIFADAGYDLDQTENAQARSSTASLHRARSHNKI